MNSGKNPDLTMRILFNLKLLLLLFIGLFLAVGTNPNLIAESDNGEQTTRSYKDDDECEDE